MQKMKYEGPMDAALCYLTAKMRTKAETCERLRKLGYCEEEIEATLLRLEELGLIDDSTYAAEYIRTRTATSSFSRAALKYQLQKHRLGKEEIEGALQVLTPEQEYEACKTAATREWRIKARLPVAERRKKVFAKLCRNGFDMDTIIGICRELAEGEEEEYDS